MELEVEIRLYKVVQHLMRNISMIETVTKNYLDGEFINYTMVKKWSFFFCTIRHSKHRLPEIQQWIADGGTVIDNGGGE